MMETKLNWGRLYQQGRCKDIGVSWTDEELQAVVSGIPAEYVRVGILTKADYLAKKEEVDNAKDPMMNKTKEELLMDAHKKDIPATSAASKETLIKELGGHKVPKPSTKVKKQVEKEEEDVKAKVEDVLPEAPPVVEGDAAITKTPEGDAAIATKVIEEVEAKEKPKKPVKKGKK